jgi:transposase
MAKFDARKISPEQQEILRMTAVRMVYEEGFTQEAAAGAVGVTRQEVVKWCKKYREGGYEALGAKKRGRRSGEQMALEPWQCAQIVRTITDKMPDQLKMPFVLWTRAAIGELIEERFEVELSPSSVGNYLRRWGFSPQKLVRKAYEQRSEDVKRWLEVEYPLIRKRALKEKGLIFWGDETKVTNEIHAGRSYAPIGETPVVRETAKKIKINVISAVTNRGDVRFMSYASTMTQNKFICFLGRLTESADKKVFFITDNLRVHHGRKVKAWVAENSDKIELCYIPSYSPELNADEYLNRDLKKNVHGMRAPRTFSQLKSNTISFLRML